jgi:dTDP-4-amino-4,6-dideoxygalactose transaminase
LTEVVKLKVPQIDLVRQYESLKKDIDSGLADVLASGKFVLGPWVTEIEKAVAEVCGCKHGIGVASGTDALTLALCACDMKPGDEVITSPFSFVSVAEIVLIMGAVPVFIDIDKQTFNLDPNLLEAAITDKTKAIVPVHLYGQSADMDPIMELAAKRSIPVIEDSAQAIGARYKDRPIGSMGQMSCLSFYPTKNLGCYGDGGMVTTNDDNLADKVASLRRHGQDRKYMYRFVGFNSRLDSMQAAILLAKMGKLGKWNDARRSTAARYDEALKGLPVETPYVPDFAHHVYHQYTIKTEARDDLRAYLGEKGIGTAIHYPMGLHLQPAYTGLGYKKGDLPNCDEVSSLVLSLPMFPEMEDAEIEHVCTSIREFFENA